MSNDLRFDGKVAIITGAGNGLGKSHALLLASRGAKVVVNDLGGGRHGDGKSSAAADAVVKEIKDAGGDAAANYDSVEDGAKIVQCALDSFGRVDIVINNAGILRDTTFHKMTQEDWDLIYRVHVLGSFRVTHAAWPHLRDQGYGRIVMTASAAGIYGNFGQGNYGAAKLALLGLSNTLALEGKKKNVLVNTIAPIAGSRLTETVLPKEITDALKPEYVSPLVALLCHESSTENGGLFEVGGGFVAKLRWERAAGQTFRLGRAISPEAIKASWSKITGFDKTEHPTDINASMAPVMANVSAGPSKGGNQFIDVDQALGYEFPTATSSYTDRDLALYALSIGAAKDPLDAQELRYVYEMHGDGFQPLPTYGVIPALTAVMNYAKEGKTAPGMNYGLDRLLHGEQYTELLRPLPTSAKLTHKIKIKDIFDKGKNALVVTEIRTFDEAGELLVVNESTAVIRGAGGWGGDRGPSSDVNVPPDRAPDATLTDKIDANQALLYRLTGDWNPLHADPNFAKAFGFDRPILHGLCTYGYAARHVIKSFSKGDPRFFKSIKVRMADSVFPGETLVTEMWKESDTKIVFRCKVKERDKVVISNAAVELYKEIPKPKAKPAAAAAPATAAPTAAAASGEPTSADIFGGIAKYVERAPELAQKIATVYGFKLTDPASAWTLDLKTGKVAAGAPEKADCTLELSDADFLAMCTGKADPQKLYFGGKLKISGNVMASQKLDFLKKVDPNDVIAAMKARTGGAAPAAAAAPTATHAAPSEFTSEDVFVVIADHIARHPEVVAKVATVFQFNLTEPASSHTVDVKNGSGGVTVGAADKADVTLDLSDANFIGMVSGKLDAQKLYFGGQLKISGNVMASQKLSFLKAIDANHAKQAVLAAHKARAGGAAPKAAPEKAGAKEAAAGRIFAALTDRLAKNPALAKEVDAVVQFRVTNPDAAWTVDMKKGSIAPGEVKGADVTLTLSDEDLEVLAKGTESAQHLHQTGRLRVDGDVSIAANRLGFIKGLG